MISILGTSTVDLMIENKFEWRLRSQVDFEVRRGRGGVEFEVDLLIDFLKMHLFLDLQ